MAEDSYNRRGDRIPENYRATETAQANGRSERPDHSAAKKFDVNTFVPPSIDMVSGKSVMGEEAPGMPLVPSAYHPPETLENSYYTAGYLKNYLGKRIKAQFLIGTTGTLVDRAGILLDVGANFIVLQPEASDDLLMCDMNSLRFVTIYR